MRRLRKDSSNRETVAANDTCPHRGTGDAGLLRALLALARGRAQNGDDA